MLLRRRPSAQLGVFNISNLIRAVADCKVVKCDLRNDVACGRALVTAMLYGNPVRSWPRCRELIIETELISPALICSNDALA